MDHRWAQLLDDLKARFTADANVAEVEAYLSSEGYERGEIGEILELLYGNTVSDHPEMNAVVQGHGMPLRVQGPHERGRFSAEAWGYLITLGGSGLVSQHDFEQLVERALMHVDGRIGIAEIRAIAEDGGFDDAGNTSARSQVH
jgi:Smg protein